MLVKGYKGIVEEETRAKEQLGREWPSLIRRAESVWLNACATGLHSFLSM